MREGGAYLRDTTVHAMGTIYAKEYFAMWVQLFVLGITQAKSDHVLSLMHNQPVLHGP